eukprot:7390223-Prymnesium_polylepis.3
MSRSRRASKKTAAGRRQAPPSPGDGQRGGGELGAEHVAEVLLALIEPEERLEHRGRVGITRLVLRASHKLEQTLAHLRSSLPAQEPPDDEPIKVALTPRSVLDLEPSVDLEAVHAFQHVSLEHACFQ